MRFCLAPLFFRSAASRFFRILFTNHFFLCQGGRKKLFCKSYAENKSSRIEKRFYSTAIRATSAPELHTVSASLRRGASVPFRRPAGCRKYQYALDLYLYFHHNSHDKSTVIFNLSI
ncbi:MAG: hypothetical protein KH354_08250, partial [Clostridiales bacterium]|nr:hypothetical protein [Clostridiales bacterium]